MTTQLPIPLERTREFWERAARYPTDKEDSYPEHATAQEFDRADHKLVLEYGCGGGSDTLSYLRRGAQVIAVDIVASNVEATVKRAHEAGHPIRGIALDASDVINLPTGLVDIVSAHGVLHHIVDPMPVLRELRRILKPSGLLYVMLYTEQLEATHRDQIAKLVEEKGVHPTEAFAWCTDEEGAPYARSYTHGQAKAMLKDAGFEVETSLDYNKGEFRTYRARRVEATAEAPTNSGKKKKGVRK